jgi:hypothetical protein
MIQYNAVVLDAPEQADRIASYLSSIARPGVKIDFLIPAKARRPVWLLARTTALSPHNRSTVAMFERRWGFEAEEERLLVERKLAKLSESLRNQGAAAAVRLYSGSLKRTLADLQRSNPQSLVVLHPQKSWLLENALRAILKKIGLCSLGKISKVSLTFQVRT